MVWNWIIGLIVLGALVLLLSIAGLFIYIATIYMGDGGDYVVGIPGYKRVPILKQENFWVAVVVIAIVLMLAFN